MINLISFYSIRISRLESILPDMGSELFVHQRRRLYRWEVILDMLLGDRDYCIEANNFLVAMNEIVADPIIYNVELELGKHMNDCKTCDHSSASYDYGDNEIEARADRWLNNKLRREAENRLGE